jgi:hypothetical protein
LADVEKLLAGRNYSVFCGHVHRYEKWVRQGMNYYQLATTGGSSRMRGMEYNEFDHFVWVTMKQDGPVLANIMIDGVHNESLQVTKHAETGVSTANRKPTFPVNGKAYFDGVPMAGAFVTFTAPKVGTANPLTATGLVEPDGSFKLSTYKAFDGAPAGEYRVSFAWRESGRTGPSLIPVRYNTPDKSGLQATVQKGANDVVLELRK